FVVGSLYMLLIGVRMIPDRVAGAERGPVFGSGDYQIEIILEPEARSVGTLLSESPLLKDITIRAVEVFRNGFRIEDLPEKLLLQAGDHLKVRCDLENFRKLKLRRGISLRQASGNAVSEEAILVEAVVAPGSTLDGRSLKQARFRSRYGLTAMAVRHRNRIMREDLEALTLRAGDVLLFEVEASHMDQLRDDKTFVLVSQVDLPVFRKSRMLTAVVIVAGVVLAAATGIVPIVAGAIVGCILMVMARCLTLDEAYGSINWQVIFLLAGVLTLGTALEKTGAAGLLGGYLVESVGAWGPMALVSALYLTTSLLTEIMSNNATAALLAPVAIAAAESLNIDSRPLLMAITFAASASFMTPVGYQTNTLIYGPGQFRYADFLRVGTPLNILFWIMATIFIPQFWPF
ncbi:MAG: potassium transporter TrkA, partial [Geobacteraceae bacterium GWF2_54_21]